MATPGDVPDGLRKPPAAPEGRRGWAWVVLAVCLLLGGSIALGTHAGLAVVPTVVCLLCAVVLVALAFGVGAVNGARARRRLERKLSGRACTECGAVYGLSVKYEDVPCFDAPGWVLARCPHRWVSARWTYEAEPLPCPTDGTTTARQSE